MSDFVPILVVDDSPAICKSITEALSGQNYETVEAHDGVAAIAAAKRQQFHVATLDVEMPRMPGTDVLRILKALDPDLFVIMVSGQSSVEIALHAIRQGAYDYVTKPFSPEEVTLSVQRALRQRSLVLENRQLIDDLKSLNQNLEDLVHQRTKELENAHAKLLTSHAALEEAYKKLADLDSLKAKFITVTSHELRTPLTTIRGYASWLASGSRSPEQQALALNSMEKSIDRLISIVSDITDISKLREKRLLLQKEPSDITKIIGMVSYETRPFLDVRRQTLETKIPPQLPAVLADRVRVHQVLSHLVLNAIRFTPDEGKISIAATPDSKDGFVKVSVSDTGIGIEQDQLKKVFDEFYEVAPQHHHHSGTFEFQSGGLGLGLSVVKGIIDEHGGRIWAESKKSLGIPGSAFHFLLPVYIEAS